MINWPLACSQQIVIHNCRRYGEKKQAASTPPTPVATQGSIEDSDFCSSQAPWPSAVSCELES